MSARRTNRAPVAAGAKRKRRARRWVPEEPRPPLDLREARRLYEGERLTVREVSRRLGKPYTTTYIAIRAMGLKRHPANDALGRWARDLYVRWHGIRNRCRCRSDGSFADYGGRGIDLCAEWERFPAFYSWARANGFRPGLVLVRIDHDGDFSPRNCRWQTRAETVRSTLRHGRRPQPWIRAFGETKTLFAWSEDPRCKVSGALFKTRLLRGHAPEAALTKPPGRIAGSPRLPAPVLAPSPPRRRPEIDWKAAERRLLSERISVTRLAAELGVAPKTARRHLADAEERLRREVLRLTPALELLRKRWRYILQEVDAPRAGDRRAKRRQLRLHAPWRRFEAFRAWAESTGYRPDRRLTRLDRRKGYDPENCHWMTRAESSRQPQGHHRLPRPRNPVEAFGASKSLYAWGHDRRCAVSRDTLRRRLTEGWDPEAALTTSVQHPGGRPARLLVTAFGRTKTLREWTQDSRCRIQLAGLEGRLKRGVPAEMAITSPPFRVPFPHEPRASGGHAGSREERARRPSRRETRG